MGRYCGTAHSVALASGTAALQLGLTALGIGAETRLCAGEHFFATVEAVLDVGATPVFTDVDPSTLLMSAANVQGAMTKRTAAVIVVHLYGQPANMDAIKKVAGATGIAIIEDAAQAHGATWRGRKAGSMSDLGCFSFYPGKNLGAFGDAGAVTTNDSILAERIRSLRNHGRPQDVATGTTTLEEIIDSMSYKLPYSRSSLGDSTPGTPEDRALQSAIDHASQSCRLNCWRSLQVLAAVIIFLLFRATVATIYDSGFMQKVLAPASIIQFRVTVSRP